MALARGLLCRYQRLVSPAFSDESPPTQRWHKTDSSLLYPVVRFGLSISVFLLLFLCLFKGPNLGLHVLLGLPRPLRRRLLPLLLVPLDLWGVNQPFCELDWFKSLQNSAEYLTMWRLHFLFIHWESSYPVKVFFMLMQSTDRLANFFLTNGLLLFKNRSEVECLFTRLEWLLFNYYTIIGPILKPGWWTWPGTCWPRTWRCLRRWVGGSGRARSWGRRPGSRPSPSNPPGWSAGSSHLKYICTECQLPFSCELCSISYALNCYTGWLWWSDRWVGLI